ncbi:hypothetical protein WOB59_00870 [Methylocystis sp. IM4]
MERFLHRLAAPGKTPLENLAKGLFWGIVMNPAVWPMLILGS